MRIGRRSTLGRRSWIRRNLKWWAPALIVAVAAAGLGGSAVGPILTGMISGSTGIVVEGPVVIDRENFTIKDFSAATDDKVVAFNDSGSSFTVAAEIHAGDVMVLDVPLSNVSNADANVIATLQVPDGIQKEIETFWDTQTRSADPTAITTTASTTPTPQTTVTSQGSDTIPATTTPTGVAGINPQVAQGTATTSSPGLPESSFSGTNTSETTTQPSGVQTNTAQTATSDATTTASAFTGSSDVSAQEENASSTTSQPSGLSGLVQTRTVSMAGTNTEPSGTPSIVAQNATTTSTTSQPAGAASSLSGTWYTGFFWVDENGDGTVEPIYFALSDTGVAGTYNTMDLSSDDATFGETLGGPLSGQTPRMTGPQDDERITASGTDVRFGPYYLFTTTFVSNPAASGVDATITAKTWFTVTATGTDLDADNSADDSFYGALSDDDSDGIYEKMDLSIGDTVFGETTGGTLSDGIVDFSATSNTNDERITGTTTVKMGSYSFSFGFDNTPGTGVSP